MTTTAKYKFAVMLNGDYMYPWQKKAVDLLVQSGLAELGGYIIQEKTEAEKPDPPFRFSLFEQYKKRRINPLAYKPIAIETNTIWCLTTTPVHKGKFSQYIAEDDLMQIKNQSFDFILRFGFGILKGDILTAAKWGIWSFHHGDEQVYRGGPLGFWEIWQGKPAQGVILQQLTEKLDAGIILDKRFYYVHHSSYTDQVNKVLTGSADMPVKVLWQLHHKTLVLETLPPVKTEAPIYKYPDNFTFLWFMLLLIRNKIKLRYKNIFEKETWMIGWKKKSSDTYQFIPSPGKGKYLADPFVLEDHEQNLIVAEYYDYTTRKGNICMIDPDQPEQIITLLEKKHHLAYPFVFTRQNEVYIMPEQADAESLHLYKWNKKTLSEYAQLLALPAVDASLLEYEGRFYIFTGLKNDLPNEKLFIFSSDTLTGPYSPHPANPVKCTPEGSRMAGNFVIKNGKVWRPGQYSLHHYGEKIVWFEIKKLSPTQFEEEYKEELTVSSYFPLKDGLHTRSEGKNIEVIDVKQMKSDIKSILAGS